MLTDGLTSKYVIYFISSNSYFQNKKAAQERDRQEAIEDQDLENLTGPRHLEAQKIKQKLATQNLVVSEVRMEGTGSSLNSLASGR